MSSAAFAALRAAKKSQPQRYIIKKPQKSRNRKAAEQNTRKEVATAEIYYKKVAKKSQTAEIYYKKAAEKSQPQN